MNSPEVLSTIIIQLDSLKGTSTSTTAGRKEPILLFKNNKNIPTLDHYTDDDGTWISTDTTLDWGSIRFNRII